MLKPLRHRPETVFALVLLWKAALLLFTAQPVPSNDSFFYDGPVVNYLIHGRYCNPALANALPISGNDVFCAYPPLYQVVLLTWMKCFGTSVLSAMWLHLVLFAAYAGLLLATLRELRVPGWAVHSAGLFLLGITFHDRPDSLAHVFGMGAVFAVARACKESAESADSGLAPGWIWAAVVGVVLCQGTSLQIGGIYFGLVGLALLLSAWLVRVRFVWSAAVVMTLVPLALVLAVKLLWPHLWAGFQEHARQTPSLTAWRIPNAMELLKVMRAVPGVLLVLMLGPILWWRGTTNDQTAMDRKRHVILLSAVAAAAAVVGAALCLLTANLVAVSTYLQPLVVGAFLALGAGTATTRILPNLVKGLFALAVLVVSVRAVGLSTVGVACARDVSRKQAEALVARELAALPDASTAGVSAAYLYTAWREAGRLRLLHADWLGPAVKDDPDVEVKALCTVKPTRLVLTQFDYYRRYVRVLGQLQSAAEPVSVRVSNRATVQPPDASPRWQRFVQHVAWAPVIVSLEWERSP